MTQWLPLNELCPILPLQRLYSRSIAWPQRFDHSAQDKLHSRFIAILRTKSVLMTEFMCLRPALCLVWSTDGLWMPQSPQKYEFQRIFENPYPWSETRFRRLATIARSWMGVWPNWGWKPFEKKSKAGQKWGFSLKCILVFSGASYLKTYWILPVESNRIVFGAPSSENKRSPSQTKHFWPAFGWY